MARSEPPLLIYFSSEPSWTAKRTQTATELCPFGFVLVSTRPSANTGTDYNLHHVNQYLCLPKAELKTITNPNGHHSLAVWVRFGVQLGSLENKWEVAVRTVPPCVNYLFFLRQKKYNHFRNYDRKRFSTTLSGSVQITSSCHFWY